MKLPKNGSKISSDTVSKIPPNSEPCAGGSKGDEDGEEGGTGSEGERELKGKGKG